MSYHWCVFNWFFLSHSLSQQITQGNTNASSYKGSAKNAEAKGVHICYKKIKDAGAKVDGVVKDNDGEAMRVIHGLFPDAREFLDLNHFLIAYDTRVQNAVKTKVAKGTRLKASDANSVVMNCLLLQVFAVGTSS